MAQPIVLYGSGPSPNPLKVALILSELDIPFVLKVVNHHAGEHKQEQYVSVNPNGRLPAIEDPNTGITLWESGAIIEYLVENYDPESKLHVNEFPQKWLEKTWLYFQTSGQGPYFGQLYWFRFFHEEKNLTSVLERYEKEVTRVTGVIDGHLKKQATKYLLGEKVCYADIAFIPYFSLVPRMAPNFNYAEEFPSFTAWFEALRERPAVKKILNDPRFQMPKKA